MPASAIFMPEQARRNDMEYFYEHESELFTFYRVPKVLFTEEPFKNMNCEAKLLYGLLLDKMGLSRKSGWFDKQGRAFVYYGINRIMEDLGCAHGKAGCYPNWSKLACCAGNGRGWENRLCCIP